MLTFSSSLESQALDALTSLRSRADWRESDWDSQFRDEILKRAGDPDTHVRYIALHHLASVSEDAEMLADLLEQAGMAESNPEMLGRIVGIAHRGLPFDLMDGLLATFSEQRPGGASVQQLIEDEGEGGRHELSRAWVDAHLRCHLHGAAPFAGQVVAEWFNRPGDNERLFKPAISSLRSCLMFDADPELRRKSFDLVGQAATSLRRTLETDRWEVASVRSADALVQELYFASGAFEGNERPRPTTEERAAWFTDAIEALELMTAVGHPRSCYQLLKTLEFLIEVDPARVFAAFTSTITNDGAFRFESLGLGLTVRFINVYLADYRTLLVNRPEFLTELRRILEVFAEVGWREALHLSYSLGDVFR